MIYTEQDLGIDYGPDAFDIINESAWVDGTSIISPNTIPMVESTDIGGVVVRFSDVEALSEEYGVDYIDSMLAIAESNDLDPAYMAVAVDESELIVNPKLIYELANVVVVPQSENSLAYQFCEACIDAYAESGNEDYIELIINEADTKKMKWQLQGLKDYTADYINNAIDNPIGTVKDYTMKSYDDIEYHFGHPSKITTKQIVNDIKKHPGDAISCAGLGLIGHTVYKSIKNEDPRYQDPMIVFPRVAIGSGLIKLGDKIETGLQLKNIYDEAKDQPRNIVAKKIASLRKLYEYWLFKVKRERDDGRASMIKQVLTRIAETIDKLLLLLQRGANKVSEYMYMRGEQ